MSEPLNAGTTVELSNVVSSPMTPASMNKTPVFEAGSGDDGTSTGKASGRGRKRAGLTAGGAGASLKELEEMPSARQKRILANRESAARSKERKLAYISELEAQVSSLTVQLTNASLQLRSLQQDTTTLGECNATLAQQALTLREHMAQRDAETASLAAKLRQAQGVLAASSTQDSPPASDAASGGAGDSGSANAVNGGNEVAAAPVASESPRPADGIIGSTEGNIKDPSQPQPTVQPIGPLRQWTHAQAQQQGQLSQQVVTHGEGHSPPIAPSVEQQQQPSLVSDVAGQ